MPGLSRDELRMILPQILEPHIEACRNWWRTYKEQSFIDTIVLPMKAAPKGVFVKFVRSPKQSCVQGLQAYPIIAPAYIENMPPITGGMMAGIEHIAKEGLQIDEFKLLPRRGLPTTLRNGFFLCVVPVDKVVEQHRYVYIDKEEMMDLTLGLVPESLKQRVRKYI